jgi:hypothetical protein
LQIKPFVKLILTEKREIELPGNVWRPDSWTKMDHAAADSKTSLEKKKQIYAEEN